MKAGINPMAMNAYRRSGLITAPQFVGAVLGAELIMLLLGSYFVHQYRDQQLQGAAAAGGLYVEGFLAPHAHEFFATQNLSAESKAKLEHLLQRQMVSDNFAVLKIWDRNGKIVYSSDGTTEDEDENPVDLLRAQQGETIVEIFTDSAQDPDSSIAPPYLEIHAPILDLTNSKIIAVGEVYQDATGFMRERAIVERSIWTVLAIFSVFGLCGLLLLIAMQRRTLLRHLDEVSAIAQQNQLLKDSANRARIEASQSNEQLLNQIGSELHDGPIQMLALMLLMGGKTNDDAAAPEGLTTNEIGNRVISELRSISTGLSLPEITDLSLQDVLLLAVSRHETFTGQKVETIFGALPDAIDQGVKICCYRFVQEGLTNSYKHASGAGQHVSAAVENNVITLTVKDDGPAERPVAPNSSGVSGGAGLRGLRNRLDVFGGTLKFSQQQGGKTELTATIPLQ